MNPNDILEQLRDIHTPAEIIWWPLAIGWWIAGISALLSVTFIIYFIIHHYRNNAWRRAALKELKALKFDYLTQANTESLSEINALLKRCISSQHSDLKYLSYTGNKWAQCLCGDDSQTEALLDTLEIELLSSGQYQANSGQLTESSFMRLEKWIKKLR